MSHSTAAASSGAATGPIVIRYPVNTTNGGTTGEQACFFAESSNCGLAFVDNKSFVDHLLRAHKATRDQIQYICSHCHRQFEKIESVRSHHNICKRKEAVAPDLDARLPVECEVDGCSRRFTTTSGMRLHVKKAHPIEYHASIPQSKRNLWSEGEMRMLARMELDNPGLTNARMNELLHSLHPSRSVDVIRHMRGRNTRYREIMEELVLIGVPEDSDSQAEKTAEPEPEGRINECQLEELVKTHSQIDDARYQASIEYVRRVLRSDDPGEFFNDWLFSCFPGKEGRRIQRRKRERLPPRNAKQKRAAEFRVLQELWRKDRSRLATVILDKMPPTAKEPPIGDIEKVYTTRFERPSPEDQHEFTSKPIEEPMEMVRFITVEEVLKNLKAMKSNNAPGLDSNITMKRLRSLPLPCLQLVFNCWLAIGKVPQSMKQCRSKLLPKGAEGLDDVNNWRPLTIGSLLIRLYTRILAMRLQSKVQLHPRQKAFQPLDGCGENIAIVSSLLQDAHERKKELNIIFLDIAKAFDCVSHHSIQRALNRFGLPRAFRRVIEDLYDGATTVFQTSEGDSKTLGISSGVKQGCPLSPVLFNMVMDELIADAPSTEWGYELHDESVGLLAFADDIALVSHSRAMMSHALDYAAGFFEKRNLQLNARKCIGLSIKKAPRRKVMRIEMGSIWSLRNGSDNIPIKMLSPADMARYLGALFSPSGKQTIDLATMKGWITSIEKSRLKPHQKLVMLRTYLLPRVLHHLTIGEPNATTLRRVERELRNSVKRFLKLPVATATPFFHISTKEGGLELPPLLETIAKRKLKWEIRLQKSKDSLIRAVADSPKFRKQFDKARAWIGVPVINRPSDINRRIRELNNGRFERFTSELAVQSRCHRALASNPLRNDWLTGHNPGLYASQFIDALKLVTSQLPTREALNRGNPQADKRCRGCGFSVENQKHVISNCPLVQQERHLRHNRVAQLFARYAKEKGWNIIAEPRIRNPSGEIMRPDIVLRRDDNVAIVDIQIPYEDGGREQLAERYRQKCSKYRQLSTHIQHVLGVTNHTIGAIIVGACGTWCELNNPILDYIGVNTTAIKKNLSIEALRGTLKIFGQFKNRVFRNERVHPSQRPSSGPPVP